MSYITVMFGGGSNIIAQSLDPEHILCSRSLHCVALESLNELVNEIHRLCDEQTRALQADCRLRRPQSLLRAKNEFMNFLSECRLSWTLLWLNGSDLRQQPLLERKQHLRTLVSRSSCERLMYAQHVNGAGKQFFSEICRLDLEGIVAKRKQSIYKDDGNSWQKIKNRNYSQAEGRHELLTRK